MAPDLSALAGFEGRHDKVVDADTSIKKPIKVSPDLDVIAGYEVYHDQIHRNGTSTTPHPLDQLSINEIHTAADIVRSHSKGSNLKFNAITLREPPKAEYAAFREDSNCRPDREAFVIVLETTTCKTSEVIVSLTSTKVVSWKQLEDVMPILTLEDLDVCEQVARKDPEVAKVCAEIGIHDMSTVYFDGWAIGLDERFGFDRRLQQGLAYWRSSTFDNHYAHPLDFCVVIDTEKREVLRIDIRRVNGERVPIPQENHNFFPDFISNTYKHDRLKPINITQPEGVSFSLDGNELTWAGYKMHVGFNYREGIVLSDVRIHDPYQDRERMLFNRVSVAEMVVPYGNPDIPHHRKHAFDIGEYGMGLMTNPLKIGCDCKGAIQYLDGIVSTGTGLPAVIPNAICIHEEDNGILIKHTDYRDGTVVSTRDRKLIVSQIITAANYEYAFYHMFTLDGTYKLEVKLTGILNTVPLHPTESAAPYGTAVSPGLNAHNHQHLFSLRIDPAIDGPNNTVVQSDAVASDIPVGEPGNLYGNAFYCRKTPIKTSNARLEYNHDTSRTWDIINPNVRNPSTKGPVGYKIVTRESAPLLMKPHSLVWKRAGFARHPLWVTKYRDHELFPAGDYVCQSNGLAGWPNNETILDWAARDDNVENTDLVCWLQFGLTHFPRTEDFPVMPAEAVSVMLRASNFFVRNPALWVPPTSVDVDSVSKAVGEKCCIGRNGSGSSNGA